MSANSQHVVQDIHQQYKRILLLVISINATMFFIEIIAGFSGYSQALKADAIDFLLDTFTYSISLWALDKPINTRNNIAKIKAYSMLGLGAWILLASSYQWFYPHEPNPSTMSTVAVLALLANFMSVLLLMKHKTGDANTRSVWLCSRNDMINNVLIIIAAAFVYLTESQWPDLLVAYIMSGLFIRAAWQILKQAKN